MSTAKTTDKKLQQRQLQQQQKTAITTIENNSITTGHIRDGLVNCNNNTKLQQFLLHQQ